MFSIFKHFPMAILMNNFAIYLYITAGGLSLNLNKAKLFPTHFKMLNCFFLCRRLRKKNLSSWMVGHIFGFRMLFSCP